MNAQQMWDAFVEKSGVQAKYDAWCFGDAPDTLAQLVLEGKKTATASTFDLYGLEGEELPKAGQYSVVLDSREEAVCVIRTEKVFVVMFSEVDEKQAWKEGEGDRSLSYWRDVHERFFRSELEEAGLKFHEDTKVVCEEFILIYP